MKPFKNYQWLPGFPMTERDKKQVGSNFWNEGKWRNFVAPHLPESGKGLSLIDMGSNAGLFLKFAQDRGFEKIIGVETNAEAVKNGREWCAKNGGNYEFIQEKMEDVDLPIVDYTVLANSHYYMPIDRWIEYIDRLRLKTRYVIIVTAQKNHVNRCWASADVASIRNYFKDWKEVGFVDELPLEGDPDPRQLWSLCFESPLLKKVEMGTLDSSNHVQDAFWGEIDEGKHYTETRYYRIMKKYRAKWGQRKLHRWLEERLEVYEDLKKNGQKVPILIDAFKEDRIVDGNNRYSMKMHLKDKYIYARFV